MKDEKTPRRSVFDGLTLHQPAWIRQVNDAMDLPLAEGRRVLDQVIAERRQRAGELRELAAHDDVSELHRRAYDGMAAWVDDSVALVEQAADRLAELETAGDVATGRQQIEHETGSDAGVDAREQDGRGWSL